MDKNQNNKEKIERLRLEIEKLKTISSDEKKLLKEKNDFEKLQRLRKEQAKLRNKN